MNKTIDLDPKDLEKKTSGTEKYNDIITRLTFKNLESKEKSLFTGILTVVFGSLILTSCNIITRQSVHLISNPEAAEVAKQFENPPAEYSLTFYWGWDGNITEEVIARDLDEFKSKNVYVVSLEPGYDMGASYLSAGWFEKVKTAVCLVKERNMRIYLIDEGKYPSGFAGGKITKEAPELGMQVLIPVDTIIEVSNGETVSLTVPDDVVSAAAFSKNSEITQILEINNGKLNWSVPDGEWRVILVKHAYRSSPTRSVNNPTRGKDPSQSLIDYLDPAATRKFMEFTHEEYKKYVGEEFGKTVLGFRGDEPDYSIRGIPWTPDIFREFEKRKGYNVQPYIAAFFSATPTEEQKRIKADYWDVWSSLFADNFFKVQSDWCADNNLKYLVHLNHEENMVGLVRSEGDFFKDMSSVQMPGVDAIWHQIWPGEVDPVFPKYASSSAHVNGHPRAFTESFAAYRPQPDIRQAKWILDQQFVRGINMVEIMFVPASSRGRSGMRGWLADEKFPDIARYIQRSCYLLSQGVPAAKTALLFPTSSIWLGDNKSDTTALEIMQKLLNTQHDFDVVDEMSLDSGMTLKNGSFINKSGQSYSTIIIPPVSAISVKSVNRLKEFEESGGKVIYFGNETVLAADKTFKDASETDLNWAVNEPSGKLTDAILEKLPQSDFVLDKPCESVKYTHRKWKDADLYFIFNEGDERQELKVTLSGKGKVRIWDAMTGQITNISSETTDRGSVGTRFKLDPWETKFIVVGGSVRL